MMEKELQKCFQPNICSLCHQESSEYQKEDIGRSHLMMAHPVHREIDANLKADKADTKPKAGLKSKRRRRHKKSRKPSQSIRR